MTSSVFNEVINIYFQVRQIIKKEAEEEETSEEEIPEEIKPEVEEPPPKPLVNDQANTNPKNITALTKY